MARSEASSVRTLASEREGTTSAWCTKAEIARVVVRTLRECGQVEAARAYRGFRRAVETMVKDVGARFLPIETSGGRPLVCEAWLVRRAALAQRVRSLPRLLQQPHPLHLQ